MKKTKEYRTKISVGCLALLCAACMLTGCGGEKVQENGDEAAADTMTVTVNDIADAAVSVDTEDTAAAEMEEAASGTATQGKPDRESMSFRYLEKYMVENYYGDGKEYEVYGLTASEDEYSANEDGFLYCSDHGLTFTASVYDGGSPAELYMFMNDLVEMQKADWESEEAYSDVQIEKAQMNGEDRYQFITAQSEDFYGTPFQVKKLYYVEVKERNVGVFWDLEINEMYADEETETVIEEIALCYGIDPAPLAVGGDWAGMDEQRKVDEQDVYTPTEGEAEMTRVDGYEYLGMATLNFTKAGIECPVMAPMGRSVTHRGNSLLSSMHGVAVSIDGQKMVGKNFLNEVESDYRIICKSQAESDYSANVEQSGIMVMTGYDEAAYFVMEYDSLRTDGEFRCRTTDVRCYIRMNEEYLLTCRIWMEDDDYDAATNAVIKELEKAYGIDLSSYYNKE